MNEKQQKQGSEIEQNEAKLNRNYASGGRTTFEEIKLGVKNDMIGLAALCVLSVILFIIAIGPYIVPFDTAAQHYESLLEPPNSTYLLGTDQLGRDVLSRIIIGGRYSLAVGVFSILIASSLGIIIGGTAGYTGREWLDETLMRLMDIVMSFPAIILGIAVMGIFGTEAIQIGPVDIGSLAKLVMIIGLIYMPRFARLTRGAVLKEKNKSYVRIAKIEGASHRNIFLREIFPNILSPLMVMFTYRIGSAMIVAAALSFLGIGIQPPTPSWGNLLANSRNLIFSGVWWVPVFTSFALAATIVCFNIIGDSIRDAIDPEVSVDR